MSAVPVMTSAAPAVTAQDLELEHAELLPARETLLSGVTATATTASSVNDAACRLRPGRVASGSSSLRRIYACCTYEPAVTAQDSSTPTAPARETLWVTGSTRAGTREGP